MSSPYPPPEQQPWHHPVPSPYPGGFMPPVRPQTNGLAVASLVTGIVSLVLCCAGVIPGIFAIVSGAVARKQVAASGGRQSGEGMAVAGLVTGIIGTILQGGWLLLYAVGLAAAPTNF